MELQDLVQLTARLRATTRKNKKTALIADFLRRTAGPETTLSALYLTGTLPQGRIGIGGRLIETALSVESAPHSSLTLHEVDACFQNIADDHGSGSAGRKLTALQRLLQQAASDERRFLAHLLMGELRQGALEGLVLEATAKTAVLPASETLQAMMFSGNIGEVARVALEEGDAGLARFSFHLFSPIAPMLAQTEDTVVEALERLGQAAV